MNIKQALSYGRKVLSETELPFLESSILLSFVLKIDKETLFAHFNDDICENTERLYMDVLERRNKGEPCAYIIGKKEFFSRDFFVDSSVLIPRPDTEILVEKALTIIHHEPSILSVLDLCTGSGCIAATMKLEQPNLTVFASDISKDALTAAGINFKRLCAEVNTIHSDLFTSIFQNFDMIIANPPYLKSTEVEKKQSEGLFEPALALTAGNDGLDIIKIIIANSIDSLTEHGYLLMEAAPDQCDYIACLFAQNGFESIEITKDLADRNRVISGRKNGNPA